MIARIAIMVLAAVLAVPEYGHGPQSDAEPIEPAVREAATGAAREIVEILVETLDVEQVLARQFDPSTVEPLARVRWFAEMLSIEEGAAVDRAAIRRAYVGCLNTIVLYSFYQAALQSPESD